MSYTKGPWKFFAVGNRPSVWTEDEKTHICVLTISKPSHYFAGRSREQSISDARLIAAAPDLLKALQDADQHLQTIYPGGLDAGDWLCITIRAAIDKAIKS